MLPLQRRGGVRQRGCGLHRQLLKGQHNHLLQKSLCGRAGDNLDAWRLGMCRRDPGVVMAQYGRRLDIRVCAALAEWRKHGLKCSE